MTINGYGEVLIQKSKNYSIKIEQSDPKQKYRINQLNRTININDQKDPFPKVMQGKGIPIGVPRIIITMPVLLNLTLNGDFEVSLQHFKNNYLTIRATGNGTIDGVKNQFDHLNIYNQGYILSNFKDSFITNADIQLEGFSKAEINMTGGDLNGDISGQSQIIHHGEIRSKNIIKH